jgi:hypothetical protein
MKTVGNSKRGGVEVRYQGDTRYPDRADTLDDVVAENCTVHLERMSDSSWYLGVYTKREEVRFFIGAARANVEANECSRDRLPRARGPRR